MSLLGSDEQRDGDGADASGAESVDEGGEERRVQTRLSKFFHMVDRLVTVQRVYPRHHPVVDNVAQRSVARLKEVLDERGEVTVELTPTEILSDWGEPVFSREETEAERFLWYNPHSDGLRTMTFRADLEADELQQFVDVIQRVEAGKVGSDDDTITLLWEKQLATISYRSLDSFVDTETIEEFNQRTSKEVVDMVVEAAVEPQGASGREVSQLFEHVGIDCLDWFTSQRVQATFEAKTVEASEHDLAFALSVPDDEIDELNGEWYSGGLLEFRFVEALLSVIRTSPDSMASEHACIVIEKMTLEMLDKEMYRAAGRVLELLHTRTDIFEDADENPLDDILRTVSEPERVDGLLWRMQKAEEEAETLQTLLEMLDRRAVQRRAVGMLANDDTELKAAGRLVEVLFELSRPEDVDIVCREELLDNEAYVGRLLGQLDQQRADWWEPAGPLITAAVDSSNFALQKMALEFDWDGWADMTRAKRTLLPLIEHDEMVVRTRSYELLATYQPRVFEERLRALLDSGELGDRELGEIRFLLKTYVQTHPANIGDLRPHLQTRGWFSDKKSKMARACARVLLEEHDEKAASTVRAMAHSLWTSPKLKSAYKRLLAAHGFDEYSEVSEAADEAVADGADSESEPQV